MASLKDLIVLGPARFLDKIYGNLEGNASSADKLKTARSISLAGKVTGSTSFDGSGNVSITTNFAKNYAGSSTDGGIANTALKLVNSSGTAYSIGSATEPVYFSNGIPVKANTIENAKSAEYLSPGAKINGTIFTGSGNITTSYWGTTRTISIGGVSKSVNGSSNYGWTESELRYQKWEHDASNAKLLYTDPMFYSGNNNVSVYNNSGGSHVTVTRIASPSGCPTPSGYCLNVKVTGTTTAPGYGGFYQPYTGRANGVFLIRYLINLPVGYNLNTASNAMGDNYKDVFITDRKGTGKWTWYVRKVECGSTGTFSSGGHVYISPTTGAAPSSSAPINWYIGAIYCYDLAATEYIGNNYLNTNVYSASKLTTARTINGTSFDGSGNITTSYWGTARTFTVGSTGKSVNGSGNVSWTRKEIGISKKYSSFTTPSNNSWGWYTIATISDSSTSPAIFLVRAYAYSSMIFTVTKGYSTSGSLNILDFNASVDIDYAAVNGARLMADGRIQIYLRTKKTTDSTQNALVDVEVNAINSSDTLTLNSTLVADDTANPSVIITRNCSVTGGIMGNLSGNATTATRIQTAGTTAQFYRGDNTWSNTIKQTANAQLGIDTNLKIGTARKDLNFDITNGAGSGINDGYAGGITWGQGTAAYAGIYYQTSGNYGSRLLFATTGSYANGSYARMIITSTGYVGIGTLSPSQKLAVEGNIYASSKVSSPVIEGTTRGQFGGTSTNSYALNTSSFICDSWIRTKGETGWYNETYGGGWHMADEHWVRVWNGKKIYTASTASDAIYTSGGVTASIGFTNVQNGVTWTLKNNNASWSHYTTDAPNGHWFNKSVSVSGNIYAGANYSDLVLTTANYASNLDSRYVNTSGDAMSGRLQLNTSVANHDAPTDQILVINCGLVPSGTTLTDKNAPGIGFHINNNSWGSLILNSGNFKFVNNSFNGYMPVYASTFYGALSGNASSATKLQTARTINGTSFDGSAAITTANWGTARTITIGATGKSVNGSTNYSWSLDEIGAIRSWSTTITCATWSRLCYVAAAANVIGSKFLLSIGATRSNAVYNDLFAITAHYPAGNGSIVKLSGNKYSTEYQIRVLNDDNGNCYVELYDAIDNATSSTTMSVNCRIIPIYSGALTKYTSFTSGTTLPTNFSVAQTMTVIKEADIQGTIEATTLSEVLPIDMGGTGASTATAALSNLGGVGYTVVTNLSSLL